MLTDASDVDDEKARIIVKVHQSIGGSPLQQNEIDASFNWVERVLDVTYQEDNDIYQAKVIFCIICIFQ